MEKQRRGGNDLLLRASSTKKEKEEKNERRSERSQPSDLERDLFLPLARSHSLFCSGLLLENVRNSRYTRREGTIRRVLTSDEPREDGGKKGSANKKNERRRRRTNEGPSFDDEQGRKKKNKPQQAAEQLTLSFSLSLSFSPPLHSFHSSQQEMCAQMYYRGKMFGFVHLYSGQEAVSTGVIR